ncbi:3-oxoacyl-[acyl-carrier protein] reductase [Nitrosomonas sp. PY1]|uniref:glucose 1-dehydrogenase n=1 Tax=Nitrosomonas sp. PY1 TaxID=1803906 RepID=UPI001FC82A4A|nr:glucose 1-dehydrogenase [Nitrosomonas sp. PY1]GKS69842.1 3-oxoacyl-[acyl-carrier protein] reductase [Nitrosomonas sp. PY1]
MKSLQGKVALVTGASRGIGAAIALALARNGAKVVVNYAQNQSAADSVCTEILKCGGECIAVQADVSDPVAVKMLFAKSISHFGTIDLLINNAGILVFKEITNIQDDEMNRIIDINFKSVFYALREATTKISDNGRVVTVSSTVTRMMLPKYGIYAATKAAIEQLTRTFAWEMGTRGITANILSPGPVDTELFRTGKTIQDIERMSAMAALGRLGEVDDIAQAVLFLVSDEARWINGQNIAINGGII